MKIKVKKMRSDAIIPTYATEGSACFDIHAVGLPGQPCWQGTMFPAGASETFATGLAFEIPPGYVMKVFSRSGHGFKNGVRLANCVGIIDSDYRGELMVKLHNDGDVGFMVKPGDRIAQAIIEPAPQVEFQESNELSSTSRGTGGFGSTGA